MGMAFSLIFYIVFGLAVKFMTLSDRARNEARLAIVISSLSIFSISSVFASAGSFGKGNIFYGILFSLLALICIILLASIFIELHNINTRVRMRRFMALFNIVDKFLTEGKTNDEILEYLIQIQKLTKREATDFLNFITDPINHQFLADVNAEIQAARMMKN
jgi:hypothetical protein